MVKSRNGRPFYLGPALFDEVICVVFEPNTVVFNVNKFAVVPIEPLD